MSDGHSSWVVFLESKDLAEDRLPAEIVNHLQTSKVQFRKKLNKVHWGHFMHEKRDRKLSTDKRKNVNRQMQNTYQSVMYLSTIYFIFVCYVFCICLLTFLHLSDENFLFN